MEHVATTTATARPRQRAPLLRACERYLTVEAEQQQHDEEENCPECGERHHGHSLGVGDEGQAWTCRGGAVGSGVTDSEVGGGQR